MWRTNALARELVRLLPECDSAWEAVGACTARADRAAAENAVRRAYLAAGLPAPLSIRWAEGPRSLARSITEIEAGETGKSVRADLIDRPLHAEERRLASLLLPVIEPAGSQWHERPPTRARREAGLAFINEIAREGIGGSSLFRRLLRRLSAGSRGERLPGNILNDGFGQFDNLTIWSLSDFAERYALLAERQVDAGSAPTFAEMKEVMRHVGWIFPYERVCWLVDRPTVLARDPERRLHRADGPAVAYPDGWSYYAWRDVGIPSWFIERKELIHGASVDRESDPGLRHIMIDIMTPEAYVRTGRACCVSTDETGKLWRRHWGWNGAWAAVEVVNGSPEPDGSFKRYFLTVPPHMRTPREAVAWTYGMRDDEYAALKLRT